MVLDSGNGTLGSPVNGGREITDLFEDVNFTIAFLWGEASVEGTEFFRGKVSELVHTQDDVGILSHDFLDSKVVLGEGVESEFIFGFSEVGS